MANWSPRWLSAWKLYNLHHINDLAYTFLLITFLLTIHSVKPPLSTYIQRPVAVFILREDKSCFFLSRASISRVLNVARVYLFRRAAFIFRVLCLGRWRVAPGQVDLGVYLKWGVRHARVLRSPADHVFLCDAELAGDLTRNRRQNGGPSELRPSIRRVGSGYSAWLHGWIHFMRSRDPAQHIF